MGIISPSILAADFFKLGEQINILEKNGAKLLHVDVMDGHFVPNLSMGVLVVESIRKHTQIFLDVHLMIEEPLKFVEQFAKAGSNLLTIHYEICKGYMNEIINVIKNLNCKVGIAINPATPIEKVYPFLSEVHQIIIMSVNPGFGGQKFIETSLDKVVKLKNYLLKNNLNTKIEIDGGVNFNNLKSVLDVKCDYIVIGNSLFSGDSLERNYLKALEIIKKN